MNPTKAKNRLINEKSPYLLQHAHNPVDWYPWGEEAFRKAKEEDKPVFLSVGYSTCHWCHVMARESFEDEQAAELLNREFVAVKVDREERPDIDAVYMAVCQALTGSGGWPLTVIMTPEQKPFYAGTYLPRNSRYGTIGLMELLGEVARRWHSDRESLLRSGDDITAFVRRQSEAKIGGGQSVSEILGKAPRYFARSFDRDWGGFGGAPKFPTPHNLIFLMRYSALERDEYALLMAERTLEQMYKGGIFDHIGGGFSRYSTDEKWLVPHFEKMLCDNALLSLAYLEAWRLTRRELYRNVVLKTLDYTLKVLKSPEGGFYCSQDADSDGVEGKFYALTQEEITELLGKTDGSLFCSWFGFEDRGNFEGKNIPNLIRNPRYEEDDSVIAELCRRVGEYRRQRTGLHTDDKILASWNALMIIALARAGRLFSEERCLGPAIAAQKFIEEKLKDGSGRLRRRWKDGEAAHGGQLEDYAFYGLALLELYGAVFDPKYLAAAAGTARAMAELFSDRENGGFYIYAGDSEQLITRPKDVYDGAVPSGNAAAALLLHRLSRLTGEEAWRTAAVEQMEFLTGCVGDYPLGSSVSLLAMTEDAYPSREVVCATSERAAPGDFLAFLREEAIPNLTVLVKTSENGAQLAEAAPFTAAFPVPDSGTLYYLCRGMACQAPTGDLRELRRMLAEA